MDVFTTALFSTWFDIDERLDKLSVDTKLKHAELLHDCIVTRRK